MPKPLGAFVMVLHGHIPYVLGHSTWPHGSIMLYEAAAETYLPLLWALEELVAIEPPTMLHLSASAYKLYLLWLGWRRPEGATAGADGICLSVAPTTVADALLPVYTILVPLYKEAAVLRQLTDARAAAGDSAGNGSPRSP